MSDQRVVRAAGGIVIRGDGADRSVLLVHRPRYDDWSFPKGKLHEGEFEEAAALREVEEETGLRCRLGPHVGAVTYTDRVGRPKVVRYWTMTAQSGGFAPTDEVDAVRWVPISDAVDVLSYVHDRELLAAIVSPTVAGPIYVVRHAKAGQRSTWRRPDDERPLTRRGRRQAERLVERFRGLELSRIVSSPFVRCVQTVEPLARSRGLEVERADALAEGAPIPGVAGFLATLDARPTAICGHGREIEATIDLLRERGAQLEGIGGLEKGSVWVLDRRDGGIVAARYLPAPAG